MAASWPTMPPTPPPTAAASTATATIPAIRRPRGGLPEGASEPAGGFPVGGSCPYGVVVPNAVVVYGPLPYAGYWNVVADSSVRPARPSCAPGLCSGPVWSAGAGSPAREFVMPPLSTPKL